MANARQFAAKCNRMATTVPRGLRRGNEQAARAIKPAWWAASGLTPSSTVAGRKVGIRDDTRGTRNITTMLAWVGAVHLVNNPTVAHIIAARRLGSRTGIRRMTNRLSTGNNLNTVFGGHGANRGAFGGLRSTMVDSRRGKTTTASGKTVYGGGRLKQFNGKKALTWGGDQYSAYAFHPGTRGKNFWPKCKQAAHRIAPQVYRASALPSMLREAGFG
jgi:hypothetical protein